MNKMLLVLVIVYLFLLNAVLSETKTTVIRGKIVIPNFGTPGEDSAKLTRGYSVELSNIEIILNGGVYKTLTSVTGEFIFYGIPVGGSDSWKYNFKTNSDLI